MPGPSTPATHLFLAAPAAAFGEVSIGLRIARELVAQGDRVVFLAGADVAVLFEGTGIRHQPIDDEVFSLRRIVPKVIERERCASLTLVDVTSLYLTLDPIGVELDFIDRVQVPVLALDFWNLREAGLEWDFGVEASPIPPRALQFERRLHPVPIARPDVGKGAFHALPDGAPLDASVRARVRAELGLGGDDRLIVLPTSRWQSAGLQNWKHHRRIARMVPERLAVVLDRLGDRAHLLHLGPEAMAAWTGLGARYRWQGQVAPDRLQALLAAADLLFSLNTTATTTFSAVAMGLPVVVAINSHVGEAAHVNAALPGAADDLRRWVDEAAPLHAFRLWPLGLHRFLTPVLAGNPFTDAFRTVELLDEDALLAACRSLLFDGDARAAEQARQSRYRETIASLPGPAEAFRSWL